MIRSLMFLLVFAIFNVSCSKEENRKYGPDIPDIEVDYTPLADLPSYWVMDTSLMSGFPTGIQVYHTTVPYSGKSMNGYCLVFDPQKVTFKPILTDVNKKPSAIYNEEAGTKYACLNGGFFGSNASYSLVKYDGTVQAINIKSLYRTYNGVSTAYYPTRAAFGLTSSYKPEVSWIYHVGASMGTVYSYGEPSPNELNKAPQPVPSASFPANGKVWDVKDAIGGSPMLIKDGQIDITDGQELIAIDNTSSRARSAIGHTSNGLVVLVAIEGNNSAGGAGLSLAELAQLMKDMGCTGAINLDGGGSTSLIVNGKETVKPSDTAGERAVMSAIIVKAK